ncbi:hypothetical protein [Thalassospira sp. UBA1131]|uniref:hypothetical protein n=1 Tax=Thalassospira sp. UBA1131 TaxID=1947672 RepID=UPI0025E68D20|nr:hypothetical protein [Thalassospira sp. UBA1131]
MSDYRGSNLKYKSLPTSASHLIGIKPYPVKKQKYALAILRKLYKARHKVDNILGRLKTGVE